MPFLTAERRAEWSAWAQKPEGQKRLVLIIVSVALLLDNMLYMVIVPIIPEYLRDIHAYDVLYRGYHNETVQREDGEWVLRATGGEPDYINEEIKLGWLFASKALVQIFVNPMSGYIIDRVGYEVPMIVGLSVMFSSTAIFALGRSYNVLFFARSLQGFGSAFADTSGLAMIADRFTEDSERSAALGIALAFISFGCLVAPPFGSVLYSIAGKPIPFLILSTVCLADALAVFMVIQPHRRGATNATGEKVQGTPMWKLFMDPPIAVCSGALIMANVSLAFLEPTITTWMTTSMPDTPRWLVGMIWLPAFFPHVLGVYVTVRLLRAYPHHTYAIAAAGLAMEGISCLAVPYTSSVLQLVVPLSITCFGIALIDTSLLPMLGHLVDTRHVSVYGSVYAIADISYSLAYAFGPIIAGWIVQNMSFTALNYIIFFTNVFYTPVLWLLKNINGYQDMEQKTVAQDGYQTDVPELPAGATNGYAIPMTTTANSASNGHYGGATDYDPLNPQW